jgi:hypothetical protein
MLNPENPFIWTAECQEAFEQSKESAPRIGVMNRRAFWFLSLYTLSCGGLLALALVGFIEHDGRWLM